jgi:hypothetical protein
MRIVGQTLFLGASVISFSTNIGWGGNNSSLTVELMEDVQPFGKVPFRKFYQNQPADYGHLPLPDEPGISPLPSGHSGNTNLGRNFYDIPHYNNNLSYLPNHYYECSGDDCYVDELGNVYNPNRTKDDGTPDPPKERNIPGKIYYEWINNKFVSRYWVWEDPGFFATGTRVQPDGTVSMDAGHNARPLNTPGGLWTYDIINTPVYFKFDNFEFIGLVKSWERNNRPGGITYSVTIEGFDELLDNCHLILQSFNGAIFNINSSALQDILDDLGDANIVSTSNLLNNNQIGGPINFPAPTGIATTNNFDEKIKRGNLPNIFNVFGFLESMGSNGFGGSKLNSEGLRASDIIDATHVLTSSENFDNRALDKAFSPFGRIITKNISNARNFSVCRDLKSFGIICSNGPVRKPINPAQNYNSFRLDLSSLPRPPDSYRIQGNPSLSITSLIRQISDDTGVDFLSVVVPIHENGFTDFVIKILTVDRTNYNPLYQIPQVVTTLERNNFSVENSSFGQEKNNNYIRKLIFGGNQQRLYQVKNYRLSYSQTNLVYNSITKQFVNLSSNLSKNKVNKIRNPELSSTRNKILSDFVNRQESDIFLRDDEDKNIRFSTTITNWSDTELGRVEDIVRGNYKDTILQLDTSTNSPRYISLLNDVISPYFGLKSETKVPIGDDTNEFRSPRPVLLDTWTNQITIVFDIDELPILSIGEPLSLYNPQLFTQQTGVGQLGEGLAGTSSSITSNQTPTPNPTDFGGPASSGINPTRTLSYTYAGFTIKETELRCPNFDSYLTYCLGKSIYSKPDLFVMLTNAYKDKGIFISAPSGSPSVVPGDGLAGVGGNLTSNANVSQNGIPSSPIPGLRTKMDMNWDIYLNHNFIKDLQILFNFIKNISDTYYGKKYAVKAPALYSYKDTQYANAQIPSTLGNISIFQGSNEIFYDYETVDGAWEEYGNYIDDSIVCGDANWHVLRNDQGLIPTILGYNSSSNIDDLTRFWCQLSLEEKTQSLQFIIDPQLSSRVFMASTPFASSEQRAKQTRQIAKLRAETLRRLARENFDCVDPNKIMIPSLDISSLDPGSYVIINKNIPNNDSFGRITTSSKLYTKSNSDKIVFLNPVRLSDPRIIVDAPGINLANASYSYTTDPNLSVITNIAIEDYCILANMNNFILGNSNSVDRRLSNSIPSKELQYLEYLLSFVTPLSTDVRRLVAQGPSINSSPVNESINPKMAIPFFIGVPIKSNRTVYGPWTNYPGLVMNQNLADNLIGNIKIEQNSDYVPWNYGGMSYLDKIISYSMNVDVNYQNIIENGRVSILGPPIFGIGGVFSYERFSVLGSYRTNNGFVVYDNNYYENQNDNIIFIDANSTNNPISSYRIKRLKQETYGSSALISNISIQTSSEGIKTTYSFQTYNPKTGLFNKQISDNIKKQNDQLLKFNKLFFDKTNLVSNKDIKNITSILETAKTSREPYSISKNATKLFGTSPVELIIGQATEFVPIPSGNFSIESFNNLKRHHHWAGIIPANEIGSELINDYDSKSAMSLDGILSPISFYPTRLNTTYGISDHSIKSSGSIVPICPRCGNTRKINAKFVDYNSDSRADTEIELACPVCSKSQFKILKEDKNPNRETGFPDINIYSLNPIVVSQGEFKNPYAVSGDIPKHSIMALGRGINLPTDNNNFLLSINNNSSDYSEFDGSTLSNNSGILMNQRFFAMRGPLMLHGWGFDTDGYPVPNATGQPYSIDQYNRPLRFVLNTGNMTNDLSKQGQYIPSETNPRLGDIITKDYNFSGNTWRKNSNKKSKFFHPKWAERPDLWPIGPIDLRWDNNRKVWDASGGCKEEILPPFIVSNKNDISTLQEFLNNRTENKCPYRNVYITLENDMIKEDDYDSTYSTRGFIDDVEYNKEPLQNGYRRLVYVVDKTGYTAPKGTKLLCRYDRLSGFYEPLSKPSVTAVGRIGSSNSARITGHYIQGRRAGISPNFVVTYDNPLGLNITSGNNGIFIFINGKWTLSATK